MSANLPKELRVNPVSIDDVKELIKEALSGFEPTPSPSGDEEIEIYGYDPVEDEENQDPRGYTNAELVEIFKKIALGKLFIKDNNMGDVVNTLTSDAVILIENPEADLTGNSNAFVVSLYSSEGSLSVYAGITLWKDSNGLFHFVMNEY